MFRLRVLVADDQIHGRRLMEVRLKNCGRGVFEPDIAFAESAEQAVSLSAQEEPFDLVLLDIDFREAPSSRGMDGHTAATRIRAILPSARIVLVSALGSLEHQLMAHKNAAVDRMLSRSAFTDDTLRHMCVWAALGRLHEGAKLIEDSYRIYTRSPSMIEYLRYLDRVRPDSNTIIYGETGTGKELSARRLNANARFALGQKERPFAAFNCGQTTENLLEAKLFGFVQGAFTGADRTTPGLFDTAQGGDLFLDEIQNMTLKLQHLLMRVIQEKTFTPLGSQQPKRLNVRIIAALNKALVEMKDDGTLMPDFVARLQQDYVEIPPLRERIEDLPLLIQTFLKRKNAADIRVDDSAMALLKSLPWKDNVRAVERVCISLASHAKVPTVSAEVLKDLPIVRALMQETTPYASTSSCQVPTTKLALENLALSYDAAKEQFERDYFTKLTKSAGSLRKAAELGRISRNTLSAKLKQLGIAPASDA